MRKHVATVVFGLILGFEAMAGIMPDRFIVEPEIKDTVLAPSTGQISWDLSMYGMGAADGAMPFWAVTNRRGLFPSTLSSRYSGGLLYGMTPDNASKGFAAGGLMTAGAELKYRTRPQIDIYSGISLAGYGTQMEWKGMIDRLYFGIGWKKLRLDIGMKDRPADFNGLSLTGGDIVYSGNARNLPGYNLSTDFIYIPGTKKILALKANFADYGLWDNRYVKHTLLHNQALFARIRLHRRVDLTLGLEVWSQWGGDSPLYGKQPCSFKDYIRICLGMSGGSDASKSDQINALGNHLGRELIRVDWHADDFKFTFQHDIPFEDGSGMGLQNFPDGVNTLNFSFNKRDKWVTDILFEFVYTKCQSGARHDNSADVAKDPDIPFHVIGGNDNYFNNGEYKSAWTYHGRTIGLPLMTPMPVNEDGQTFGVCNNRITAYHFGLKGKIARTLPYKFLFTYSRNFGQYSQRLKMFDSVPEQFSTALEVEWNTCGSGVSGSCPGLKDMPLSIGLGLYADFGRVLPSSFGLTLRFSWSGRSGF